MKYDEEGEEEILRGEIFQIDNSEFLLPGTDDYYKDIEEEIQSEKELRKQIQAEKANKQIHDSKKRRSFPVRKMGGNQI